MQRAAILAAFQISVGVLRLFHRQIFGQRHHAQKLWPILLQPAEIHPGEFDRRNFLRSDQFRKLWDSRESQVFD